jgi:hypothetical protein
MRVEICPRHYGICLDEIYRESNLEHDHRKIQKSDLTQRNLLKGRIKWMVKRGDVILPDSPIISSVDFESHVSTAQYEKGVSVRVTFVATSLPDPPSDISGLRIGKKHSLEFSPAYTDVVHGKLLFRCSDGLRLP